MNRTTKLTFAMYGAGLVSYLYRPVTNYSVPAFRLAGGAIRSLGDRQQ